MIGLIVRRLLVLPLILLVIYTITLTLAWKIPGSPLEQGDGRQVPAEVQRVLKAQYRLDNFWSFYFSYIGNATGFNYVADTITGEAARREKAALDAGLPAPERRVFDLGPSLRSEAWTCNDIIASSLPVSVAIGAGAMLFAIVLGVSIGVLGALKPNSKLDIFTLSLALVGVSLPSFVVAEAVLVMFGVIVPFAPPGVFSWRSAMLAMATLGLPYAAYIARLTRMGMIDALRSDYVRTARAAGVGEPRIVLRHALRNALLPVVSYTGPACAMAMTGSFVVERVFQVPGMGQHFVDAVLNKDLFLIIAVVLVYSTLLILMNLAVDVISRWIDPRTGE